MSLIGIIDLDVFPTKQYIHYIISGNYRLGFKLMAITSE